MTEYDETDVAEAVGAVFGHGSTPKHEALFREAGFDDVQAKRGAQLMESGAYLGFADVATSLSGVWGGSLGADNRPKAPGVTPERIAEVAKCASGAEVSEGGGS